MDDLAFVPQRVSNESLSALTVDTQSVLKRIAELEKELRNLISYIDAGRNLSAQPNHPAHAARKLLEDS